MPKYEYRIAGVQGSYGYGRQHERLTREEAIETLNFNLRKNQQDGIPSASQKKIFAQNIHIERREVGEWERVGYDGRVFLISGKVRRPNVNAVLFDVRDEIRHMAQVGYATPEDRRITLQSHLDSLSVRDREDWPEHWLHAERVLSRLLSVFYPEES